jgi:hypothetical protein
MLLLIAKPSRSSEWRLCDLVFGTGSEEVVDDSVGRVVRMVEYKAERRCCLETIWEEVRVSRYFHLVTGTRGPALSGVQANFKPRLRPRSDRILELRKVEPE